MTTATEYFNIQSELIQYLADKKYKGNTQLAGYDYSARIALDFNIAWRTFPEMREEMKEIFKRRIDER